MSEIQLSAALATLNNSVTSRGNATDADLRSCCVELINGTTGELVDKQPLSRLLELFYNYCTTDKILDLIDAIDTYDAIKFEDANVKTLCVENFGGNIIDGEITKYEAAQVTSLGAVFKSNTAITKFNELKYFTGLKTLSAAFQGCSSLSEVTFPAATLNASNTAIASLFAGGTSMKIIDLRPLKFSATTPRINLTIFGASTNTSYKSSVEEVYFPECHVNSIYYMVGYCSNLTKVDMSLTNLANMGTTAGSMSSVASAFAQCPKLYSLIGGLPNSKRTTSFAQCNALSHASAVALLQSLGTAGSGSTITFHQNVHLTAEEAAIGTDKGFTVTGYTLDS